MATYTLDAYQKEWGRRANELRRAARRASNAASQFMVATARRMAPAKTNQLRMGIRARPIKGAEFEVSSTVPKSFPYNLWVNRSAPYIRIHPWWNQFKPTVYGDGSHIHTGAPGFWNLAIGQTTKVFGRVTRANVASVFKGTKVRLT